MAKKQPSTNPAFIDPRRPQEWSEKQVTAALKKAPLVGIHKVDGVRLHITLQGGKVHIWSRAKLPFPGLYFYDLQRSEDYPQELEGYTLEAEAVTFDSNGNQKTAAETSGDLQRINPAPLDRGRVALHFFDFHDEALRDQAYTKRLKALINVWHTVRNLCKELGFSAVVYPIQHIIQTISDVDALYQQARERGLEGVVISPDGPYSSGKKIASGWKLKPEETLEATITGFIEAISQDGTPKAQVGSFEVTFEDGTEGRINAGALTHLQRAEVWCNRPDFLGRLCEVTAMERTEDGKARHGNFHRWRDTPENKGVKV